uniref:myotubularin-related protein 14 isoform X2 n=1 Tax=Myxine glutinosa TaxID=7769 RepID=UPI00358E9C65
MIRGNRYDEIKDLIEYFSRNPYKAREGNAKVEEIQTRCLELFARDYALSVLDNTGGLLCGHYPPRIALLEYQITSGQVGHDERYESTAQVNNLRELVSRSRMARCRSRFICPVILYNGKHICRSSTLAGWGEIYGRSGYNYLFSGAGASDDYGAMEDGPAEEDQQRNGGDSQLFNRIRGYDIRLLRHLGVKYICDLMVENKKVKFGMNVTSSEKVDKEGRYADFCLVSLPYPGCEFFKTYRDRDYTAEGLVFNWNQEHVDAPLFIPPILQETLGINWHNYMDGAIHRSLGAVEILYLTIAYDWFLFGHMLDDRLSKGEEIFFFCLNFLKHITGDEFSVNKRRCKKRLSCVEPEMGEELVVFDEHYSGSSSSLSSGGGLGVIGEDCPAVLQLGDEAYSTRGNQGRRRGQNGSPLPVLVEGWGPILHQMDERTHGSSQPDSAASLLKSSSPLAVPGRERTNSCERSSSCDSEGWQIVSGSGSLHGQARLGPAGRDSPQPHDGHIHKSSPPSRQLCLEEVRTAFLAAYSQTVGLSPTPLPPPASIGGILETFVRGLRA